MLDKLNELTESHGELKTGHGLVSGVIALSLAILCFLGVLAFHFPEYLTTPQLRKSYDVELIRKVMFTALVVAGGISLVNIVFNRARWLSSFAFLLVALTAFLGGHKVEVDPNFPDHTPYIGLDWFILDLLGSSLIFIFIEKLFALRREQPVFRAEWQTDFHHFIVNHMVVGFVLLATNLAVHRLFGWAAHDGVRGWVQGLNFFVALFLIVLVADLVQYWTHRAYHEVPLLWRLHQVHHSDAAMNASTHFRQHPLQSLLVIAGQLPLLYALGIPAVSWVLLGVLALVVQLWQHAEGTTGRRPDRWLSPVLITPSLHRVHHHPERARHDSNYGNVFSFWDRLCGTLIAAPPEPASPQHSECPSRAAAHRRGAGSPPPSLLR